MNPRVLLWLLGRLLHGFSNLMGRWPILLIAVFLISPIGPHLRVSYEYYGDHNHPYFLSCTYLGSRGFITPDLPPDCPVIVPLLDARPWKQKAGKRRDNRATVRRASGS